MMGDEIESRAQELARLNNESVDNSIKFYPTAWTDICNSLSENDREEYEQLVDDWNEYGTSWEIRKRYFFVHFV
jgi:hypothetical protein